MRLCSNDETIDVPRKTSSHTKLKAGAELVITSPKSTTRYEVRDGTNRSRGVLKMKYSG